MSTPRYALIAGTTKGGTTSLFRYLADHPGVSPARIKETRFFLGHDYPLESRYRYSDGPEKYETYFGPPDERVRVEATPDYLYSTGCAERIERALPGARLVFALRDPLTRLSSWFRFGRQTGEIRARETFESFVERQVPAPGPGTRQALLALEQGRYAGYLETYLRVFGRERVHVLFTEDLARDPLECSQGLARFAGIDPEFYGGYTFEVVNPSRDVRSPALHRAYMKTGYHLRNLVYRAPAVQAAFRAAHRALLPMYERVAARPAPEAEPTPALRARLVEHYVPSVRALEELLGRRVPWPDFARAAAEPPAEAARAPGAPATDG